MTNELTKRLQQRKVGGQKTEINGGKKDKGGLCHKMNYVTTQ